MPQEAVEHEVGGRVLRGTAYVPEGDGPFGAVLLNHGFGGDRVGEGRRFVLLGRALADAGLLAVSYDRAGHGESDGDFFDVTPQDEVDQVKELLAALAGLVAVRASDVHFVGMSMGSVLASVAAAEAGVPVASLTMFSPAAVFHDEIVSGSLQGVSLSTVEDRGYFDFSGLRLGPAYLAGARAFDPYARASGYRGPVRVFHGERDAIVPVEYARRYADVYGEALELTVVPGAGHGWGTVPHRDMLTQGTLAFIDAHRG